MPLYSEEILEIIRELLETKAEPVLRSLRADFHPTELASCTYHAIYLSVIMAMGVMLPHNFR